MRSRERRHVDLALADLHVHTHHSDGEDSPAEVVEQARRRGLKVIAVTDHDRIDGALIAAAHADRVPGCEVIVGEEVSTRNGHVLGLFLTTRIRPGMSAADTVRGIHDQDGIAIAAHPFWRTKSRAPGRLPHGVGDLIAAVGFDAVEILNGGFTPSMVKANLLARWANARIGLAEIGGSDAHVKQAIGSALTVFAGSSAFDLRESIVAKKTRAKVGRPSAVAIGRYLAWGLTVRPQPAAEVL